jgi:hypothetical protein
MIPICFQVCILVAAAVDGTVVAGRSSSNVWLQNCGKLGISSSKVRHTRKARTLNCALLAYEPRSENPAAAAAAAAAGQGQSVATKVLSWPMSHVRLLNKVFMASA